MRSLFSWKWLIVGEAREPLETRENRAIRAEPGRPRDVERHGVRGELLALPRHRHNPLEQIKRIDWWTSADDPNESRGSTKSDWHLTVHAKAQSLLRTPFRRYIQVVSQSTQLAQQTRATCLSECRVSVNSCTTVGRTTNPNRSTSHSTDVTSESIRKSAGDDELRRADIEGMYVLEYRTSKFSSLPRLTWHPVDWNCLESSCRF